MIRVYPIRRFSNFITVARPPSVVSSLSGGAMHTSLLAGCADGTVLAVNPMRKVIKDRKNIIFYEQKCFQYEWSRRGAGLGRFTEGFKVEIPVLFRHVGEGKIQDGMLTSTIHEEETNITHVEWNPNERCGAWMAAATGSGLVRVEDLAL